MVFQINYRAIWESNEDDLDEDAGAQILTEPVQSRLVVEDLQTMSRRELTAYFWEVCNSLKQTASNEEMALHDADMACIVKVLGYNPIWQLPEADRTKIEFLEEQDKREGYA